MVDHVGDGVYEMPTVCPSCGQVATHEADEAALRCSNPDCPAQRLQRFIHFASRDAMDIEGLGPAVLEQFVDEGLVEHIDDLYTLTVQDIQQLEGKKEKSAENIIEAINASREADLSRLIFALGIRHIGQKAAKLLAQRFLTMEAVMAASREDLLSIDGFGEIMADNVLAFFALEPSRELIERLAACGVNMTCTVQQTDRRFEGMTFVLTGTLPTLTRDEAAAIIERYGGKTSGSVSKKTSVVLAGEAAGSKLKKAQELGIRIIDQAEFEAMLV